MQRQRSLLRRQFVFVAFGRGVVLDHAPRWWERIWLRFSLLLRPGEAPRPLDDLIEPAGPHGPDIDGTAGAADRVPRRPPDKPLAGAVALPEPASGSICPAAVSMSGSALRSSGGSWARGLPVTAPRRPRG